MEEAASPELELPGFRFHPTEEELVDFYLRNTLHGKNLRYDVIGFLDIYRHDPSELPGLARLGEREWYFYVPMDRRRQGNGGGRPSRMTGNGFWKATGSDRKIVSRSDCRRVIGLRKTLVFYNGRAPRGSKTDWVMNEYRVPDNSGLPKDMVLCKIYKKATSLKVLEQRVAVEEAVKISNQSPSSSSPVDATSAYTWPNNATSLQSEDKKVVVLKQEEEEGEVVQIQTGLGPPSSTLQPRPRFGRESLPELEVPRIPVTDWTQDVFWSQFNSPWLPNLIATPHANTLNFLAN